MKLRHLHIPHITTYSHAASLQDHLVRAFLASKAANSKSTQPQPANLPTIITFSPASVYTTGRRDVSHVSAAQLAHLTAPTPYGTAEFHAALRGGQTTYHGPGQLVAYPILDLKAHSLGARCYVNLLERAVIKTLAHYKISGICTDNPGVWTESSGGSEKICAIGVHLRRNIASHGIGLNVDAQPLPWLQRIVACGLEGKGASSLEKEGAPGKTVDEVGDIFVQSMAQMLDGVESVTKIEEQDLN